MPTVSSLGGTAAGGAGLLRACGLGSGSADQAVYRSDGMGRDTYIHRNNGTLVYWI